MQTFKDTLPLAEGINDPGIFKAVFLAGGPGSGKSFIVGQTALTSFGLKLVNSDDAFENMLKKAGIEANPENIFSGKGQTIRDRAKGVTKNRQQAYINGRLGLVIDGTGKDFGKIQKQVVELRKLGYDVAMVFVNTDLETAKRRNKMRARSLPTAAVTGMWNDVQKNIGKFQNLFGRHMFVVDNSAGANWQGATQSVYRRIGQWVKTSPDSPSAKRWITAQKKARNIKEEKEFEPHYMYKGDKKVMAKKPEDHDRLNKLGYSHDDPKTKKVEEGKNHSWKSEGHYTKDGKEWSGPQHAHDGQVMTGEKHTADSQDLYHFKELDKEVQKRLLAKMKLKEDLRKWFGKGKKGDWVRVGTDGEIKGDCAREPGEGKPKCMPRSKAHSMSKDDRATSARRKRRKDPVADRSGKGGKPIMVKTDVEEACWTGWKKQGMKKKGDRIVPNCVKEDLAPMPKLSKIRPTKSLEQRKAAKSRESDKAFDAKIQKNISESPRWMIDPLARTVYRMQYKVAVKQLKTLVDRKKKESGGRLRHSIEYYAHQIAKSMNSDKVDARTLAKMVAEEAKYEWGTPESTAYMKSVTPGEGKTKCPECGCECGEIPCRTCGTSISKVVKEDCGCEDEDEDLMKYLDQIETTGFKPEEIEEIESDIDALDFDDLVDMGLYDEDELEEIEVEIEDDIEITEVLSIQGRMKRRFNARRNRQKLKVARQRRGRMASDPNRIKRRAARGARTMMKNRLARGRDVSAMPPAEKARIENLLKKFQPLVTKMAQRMVPQVRKAEISRLKKRGSMKPQASKKFKVKKGGSASKYKAKKFKIKKAGKK